MCSFLLEKHKELFCENEIMDQENHKLTSAVHDLLEQTKVMQGDLDKAKDHKKIIQTQNNDLDVQVKHLNEQITQLKDLNIRQDKMKKDDRVVQKTKYVFQEESHELAHMKTKVLESGKAMTNLERLLND